MRDLDGAMDVHSRHRRYGTRFLCSALYSMVLCVLGHNRLVSIDIFGLDVYRCMGA